MYNGFTTSQEQDRDRWKLMQARAAAIAAAKEPNAGGGVKLTTNGGK